MSNSIVINVSVPENIDDDLYDLIVYAMNEVILHNIIEKWRSEKREPTDDPPFIFSFGIHKKNDD